MACSATCAIRPSPPNWAANCATGSAGRRRSRRCPISAATGAREVYLKREDLAHTGCAQDQQRTRPGAARAPARRASRHRRDRRRPAWRGDGGRLRACWPALRGVHGRRRRAPPGARTWSACTNSVRRSCRWKAVTRPCVPRSTRRSATGCRTPRAPTTCWARRWVRILIPTWCASCSPVIGREARAQFIEATGALPDVAVACVGGGSNAIGLFHPFIGDASVALLGVEAGGRGPGLGDNSATLSRGTPGVLHGTYSLLLQDADGQVQETHSISAGLDYSGVGPEHALLQAIGRVQYTSATDSEALRALRECCASEGILPALESAHALRRRAPLGARQSGPAHSHRSVRTRRQGHADAVAGISWPAGTVRPSLKTLAMPQIPPHERITAAIRNAAQHPRRRAGALHHRRLSGARASSSPRCAPLPRPAMWSKSACRSATPWPTASPSSAPAARRSPTASRCAGSWRS